MTHYVRATKRPCTLYATLCGISKERNWIKYVSLDEALAQADFAQRTCCCCLSAEGRKLDAHISSFQPANLAEDEADRVPGEHFTRTSWWTRRHRRRHSKRKLHFAGAARGVLPKKSRCQKTPLYSVPRRLRIDAAGIRMSCGTHSASD